MAPFLAGVLLMLAFVTVPRHAFILDDGLSERAVLSFAHQQKLQFGTDIVFTYGPLAFLTSRYFFSHAAGFRMVVDALVCFTVSAGACLAAWRLALGWRCLLLGVFVFLAANIDPRFDLLLYIGLLCWGLLCLTESGSRLALSALSFALLAAFGILAKVSFFFIAGLSVSAIACDLFLRGKPKVAVGMLFWSCLGGLLCLGACAPCVMHIRPIIINALSVIHGYDQTVGMEGLEVLRSRGLLLAILAIVTVLIYSLAAFDAQGKQTRWRRLTLLAWLMALIFMIWKHGFVRADLYHTGFFFGFVPILVLALELLPS